MSSVTEIAYSKFRDNLGKHLKEFLAENGNDEVFAIVYKPKGSPQPAQVAAYVVSPKAYESHSRLGMNLLSMADMDSPAALFKGDNYPAEWGGKVPATVKIATTVSDTINGVDLGGLKAALLPKNTEAPCWVNSHGVVYVWLDGKRKLQLHPGEFEVMSWVESGGAA